MYAVATYSLTKRYRAHLALRDLSFHVPQGTIFGFLGPNAAGKTTTLRLLLGLLRATGGRAEVLGRDAWRGGPALRAEVGYLPGDVRFYDWMTGRATLNFLDAARGSRSRTEMLRLVDRLDLDLDRRVFDYSRGMKQKLGLIAALMHRPRLLILDEPTVALDPLVRDTLYGELRAAAGEGRTVLFSSHTLAEVEELCEEVAILRQGRLVEQARMDVLRERAVRHVDVRLQPGTESALPLPDGLAVLQQMPGRIRGQWTGRVERLLDWLSRCAVLDLTIAPPDLDDLFRAYYSGQAEKHA